MNLEAFLHGLHFDVDTVRPSDHEVDWEDAPLPYKLYRGLPVIPLSSEVPLTFEGMQMPAQPDLLRVGHFLWYVFGLTQLTQSIVVDEMSGRIDLMDRYRRFAPSGGALYPSELYLYLKLDDRLTGVYHYDVSHHRLVSLREGNFDAYLDQALGRRCDLSQCFGTVFVSTMFWKNFFKYHNFACRLQGLDAGVMIGQMLEVAKRFGFAPGVYFQFIDQAVNHLLGLSDQEESVFALIPLSTESQNTWFQRRDISGTPVSAAALCSTVEPIHHHHFVRSRDILPYPMLTKLNTAAMLDSTDRFRQVARHAPVRAPGERVQLPRVERIAYDFASVCRQRYSPDADFILHEVSGQQLAALLYEATTSFAYLHDVDESPVDPDPHVSLFCCLYNVDGIANGAYQYDIKSHALRPIRLGDHRSVLQSAMWLHNVNLYQVPICLHVVGDRDHLTTALGYRGHRIQQMEAGMLVQRLLLAASALGMGGNPILGFDVNVCDSVYDAGSSGKTCLIQIPVGPHRLGSKLDGGLHG